MSASARIALSALIVIAFAFTSSSAHAAPVKMTADEYRLYKEYEEALKDPRIEKIPEAKRLAVINKKNFKGVSEKTLRLAIDKGEALGANVGKGCEAEIRVELEAAGLKGRIGDIIVDATTGHVVTSVEWRNDDGGKIEEEAATVALVTARAAPITSTIALWAKAASGQKVFEAKIGADAASHFSQDRIAMFARARYIRVFEDVHNAYTGTPPPN